MTYWTRLDVRPVPHLGTVKDRETPRDGFIRLLLAMLIVLFVAATLRGAPIPSFAIAGHSQGYVFDRTDTNDVAWFVQVFGPNEIPSAPRRIYVDPPRGTQAQMLTVPTQFGAATPEPGTADLLMAGLIVAMTWRLK
jgi:hypothetical protein